MKAKRNYNEAYLEVFPSSMQGIEGIYTTRIEYTGKQLQEMKTQILRHVAAEIRHINTER